MSEDIKLFLDDEADEARQEAETEQLSDLNQMLTNKLKQTVADYENFRNRSEREKLHMYDKGVKDVATTLLPIMDNFELATKNADTTDSFVKGVLMIQSQLTAALNSLGIEKIEALGQPFDIKYHSAISHIESADHGEGEIVECMQAGYVYKGEVLRHAVVVVAN